MLFNCCLCFADRILYSILNFLALTSLDSDTIKNQDNKYGPYKDIRILYILKIVDILKKSRHPKDYTNIHLTTHPPLHL